MMLIWWGLFFTNRSQYCCWYAFHAYAHLKRNSFWRCFCVSTLTHFIQVTIHFSSFGRDHNSPLFLHSRPQPHISYHQQSRKRPIIMKEDHINTRGQFKRRKRVRLGIEMHFLKPSSFKWNDACIFISHEHNNIYRACIYF